jgi:uncharacterized membrane protein
MMEKNSTSEIIAEGVKSRLTFEAKWTDKLAQFLTESLGTMWFLAANALFFFIWIVLNINIIPGFKSFDPFPFGFLTMIVSLVAIFLSVIVLISQNRQGKIADIRQQVDLEVNVRAENEVTKILTMLEEIQAKLGVGSSTDLELEEMKKTIDVNDLHSKIEQV